MKANDIIRAIKEKEGLTLTTLASRLHLRDISTLSQRLRQENISIDKMNEMLQAMGYKMVVMPINTPIKNELNTENNWYEIN